MPKFLFCSVLLCFLLTAQAQTTTKFDLRFYTHLQEGNLSQKPIPLLVKGDEEKIKQLAEAYGGRLKYSYNRISSIEIPENKLIAFSQNKEVEKIESHGAKGIFLMDTVRIRNNIDSVLLGSSPLQQPYTGKNVVMGIIDGGIYWQHADFRDPITNATRIRYIWDQVASGSTAPLPYNYGSQWSWLDINSGNCSHIDPASDNGHGTCVAGIAAGNGHSVDGTHYQGLYTGVAPETEIVFVRIKDDANFVSNVADAADYIFKKADALGKPCVINTSIGTYYGSHDGVDLTTEMIEAMLDQRKGRVLVAAAGNAGDTHHHLGYQIPADSAYTFFKYNTQNNEVYFDLWADTADFKNARFAVGCNDTFGVNLGRLQYLTVPINFNPAPGNGVVVNQNLFNSTNILGQVSMQVTLDEGRYHVEFLIQPIDVSNFWRLQTSGTGKFDLWSSSALIGSADIVSFIQTGDTANPQAFIQYPDYRHPDSLKTMVSSWQCSNKVVTVGNYSNRAGYFDRDSVYREMTIPPFNEIVGKRFVTSSFGPTRDGRLKPDVMASGSTTICTGDSLFISLATNAQNRKKVSVTKQHIRNGGTSMSSPVVAGIAALYLSKRPTATYQEIKQLLIWTATKDSFTGSVANPEYGNGKVNGFGVFTYAGIIYGAKDTACMNYNAFANIDTGGCILRVYGCMDSTADNFNPAATISDNSCVYTGIAYVARDRVSVTVVPNPFANQTTFYINHSTFDKAVIKIYNQLGSVVDEWNIVGGKTVYPYATGKLPKGVYHYLLSSEDVRLKTGKLVVE